MVDAKYMEEALKIRKTEYALLNLFRENKISGTIHTCVGQEFSAIAFAGKIFKQDFVLSNHRNHGHFLSFTKDYFGFFAELLGKRTGVSEGYGGSQHLHKQNFFSNGIVGGMLPIAAGIGFAQKLMQTDNIVLVFIGDGAWGQGCVYETLNVIAKWNLPVLVVCENNFYSQSTRQEEVLAGCISKRAESFGIEVRKSDIWHLEDLFCDAESSIQYVRGNRKPIVHIVNMYRLEAHSKGDDLRDIQEIEQYKDKDPIERYKREAPKLYAKMNAKLDIEIS